MLGRLLLISMILGAVSIGCRREKMVVSGVEVHTRIWLDTVANIESRASFDLQCPADQLTYHLLARERHYPSQVGVEGCGERAVYLRERLQDGTFTGWYLDSASVTRGD
ncbi:MAG: hypothetical protein CMN30_27995 [Sandaracinus sp.]|nr:hypothetical protein [Sandaracinus sp.]|tara:strand:+ start:118 stop:444 length:327 start_codon:yes stop_codon:yes gene_type:complete